MKLFDCLLGEYVQKAICLFDYLFWCWKYSWMLWNV